MRLVLTVLLAQLLAGIGGADARADTQDKCYDWTEAAPIVRRERLASAKVVHELARERIAGELMRITLCEERGQFVYRLVVQEDSGRMRHVTLDARKPF